MKNQKLYTLFIFACAGLLMTAYTGCKKYDNPPPVFEDLKDLSTIQRKILIISIDGLTGSELKNVAPTNIVALQKTGKYSYDVLNSAVATDASGWASLLKGVTYGKHQISKNSFDRDLTATTGDFEDALNTYRNIFDFVSEFKSVKTAVITPWLPLRGYLTNTDFSPIVNTDLAVKDSTVNIIANQTQIGALIVNFKDVEAAGANGGFVASNANYKNAIIKADEYVGNITKALVARKNYAKEDWLVIVTTNHGGSSDAPEKGFVVLSNPSIKQQEVKKTGYNAPYFGSFYAQATPGNKSTDLFDVGLTNSITVQMDTKFGNQDYYPTFLGKSTGLSGGDITGWTWNHYGDEWYVTIGGTANGGYGKYQLAATVAPGTAWHTLTMVINTTVNGQNVPTARTLRLYMDGNPVSDVRDVLDRKSLSTPAMFKLGNIVRGNPSALATFYAANLEYFNIALDDATIKANYKLKDLTKHPNYANLVGYWPMNEGALSVLNNSIAGGTSLNLANDYAWTNFSDAFPAGSLVDATATGVSIIPTTSDVAANALYWMKIKILPAYDFEGNPFLNKFEIEFLK
ncbi:DUF4983 domain-containing protein [Pedobacter changchengzhani]|uniref:DUF4983 domain-containing protein n=1 Tax=Pedobacter changchengzhani TaxID=2529274 RepID=A0A4R5ML99_9SPHI|nr:alkaline phosphatase family protein [Pedobacter changchengzhani]TDG36226.1 DUF4983 domain-containing protein [Pedobacter changchengzhani]